MKKLLAVLLLISNITIGQIINLDYIRIAGPELTVTPLNLSGFSTQIGVASPSQSFTVSGAGLTTDVSVTVTGPYEVSTDNSTWFSSRTLTRSGAALVGQPVTVYVRIRNDASAGSANGTLPITTTGASSSVVLTGSVETPDLIINPSSLTGFSATEGNASGFQSFTVSGDNLIADATVTAPTDFEVSLSSGSGYAASVNLGRTGTNLTGEPVTVYTRIKSTATVGAKSGNITVTSTSASTENIAVSGTVSAPSAAVRMLFDLGGDGSAGASGVLTTSPVGSLYWNNITSSGTNKVLWISNPVDVDNNTVTGFSIYTDKKPGGGYTPGDSSTNNGGYTTAISDYHVNAVRDNIYFHSSAGVVTLTFIIPAGKQAEIKFWGGRNTTGTRVLQIKRSTDGSYTQEYDAVGNQTYTNAVTFTSVSGTTLFNLQVKAGSDFGHLSILDITLTDL